jgi:prepilin-type N-terminal cleavage/methylation domain-containing protein
MIEHIAKRMRQEEGFTLIELMIVIVILGILAGVVIFSVNGITDRGTLSACKTDLKTIEVGVEAFNAKNSAYPANLDPALTTAPNQFLRKSDSLTGDVQAGKGYNVTYDPATHDVTSDLAGC